MNIQETFQRYLENDLLDRMLNEELYPESLELWRVAESKRLHQLVAKYPNARVVDFACGDGRHLESLRQAELISWGLGIDIDPAVIDRANATYRQYTGSLEPTIQFTVASMDHPDVSTDTDTINYDPTTKIIAPVDVVYCMFSTLLATENPSNAFKNMVGLLKPGGTAFLSVYGEASVPDRIRWYESIGEGELISNDNQMLEFTSGFTSGFVTEATAIELFGRSIKIEPCSDFGYIITQQAA